MNAKKKKKRIRQGQVTSLEEGLKAGKSIKGLREGFPGGAVVKNPPANAGGTGSSPGPGRSHMPRNN